MMFLNRYSEWIEEYAGYQDPKMFEGVKTKTGQKQDKIQLKNNKSL